MVACLWRALSLDQRESGDEQLVFMVYALFGGNW